MDQHQATMQRALALARQGEGYTSPNPAVGAVIVKDGRIVGEGYHHKAGAPHAEIEALRDAGDMARGATMYVTLEPCNHHGRTGPCTEAIIKAGIANVYYATGDANPLVAGSGHQRLAKAGINVVQGPCASEARQLNRFFFHYIQTDQPYVIAKFAASLDGKIATHSGHSQWITGGAARQKSHTLRHKVDAILVGAETAIADNPRLTTRIAPSPSDKLLSQNPIPHEVRHPLRVVLDSRGRVPLTANLFQPELPGKTLVATTSAMPADHRAKLNAQGVETVVLPANESGRVDVAALLSELGQRKIISMMVEGGSQVLGSFFERSLVNEVWAFLAPMVIGGTNAPSPVGGIGFGDLLKSCRLQSTTVENVGDDFLIRGYVDSQIDSKQSVCQPVYHPVPQPVIEEREAQCSLAL